MQQRFLIIDGNFYFHRTLHGMRIEDKENNLDTAGDCENYAKALKSGLHILMNTFINKQRKYVDSFVFVFDSKSWRRDVPPYYPYFLDEDEPAEYKANRIQEKKESDINYFNFEECNKDFIKFLNEIGITNFRIDGAEGDDLLCLLKTKLLKDNPENKIVVFCTDGDLKQLGSELPQEDSLVLFRNISSNNAPEGEFCIPEKLYNELYNTNDNILNRFLSTQRELDMEWITKLFGISFKDILTQVDRTEGAGISPLTPNMILLNKAITGDKKDNVFPILRWKAKTGTRNYSVTENHIKKAFAEINLEYDEFNCGQVLANGTLLNVLIETLYKVTKQEEAVADFAILPHFYHNLRILDIRTPKFIPDNIKDLFEGQFIENKERILKVYTIDDIEKLFGNGIDRSNSNSIINESIPDELLNDITKII